MIRVEHLNKSFDSKKVLSDINVTFEEGKVNLIIGKSGSGKTVLLKSLIGLHKIDSGKIFYGDRDITLMNIKQIKILREEIGVVFQGGALFDSMTVLENVMFPLNLFTSLPEKEKKDTIKKTCQRTFQALRIDVNREFEVLYEFMEKLPDALKPGGRVAILTFHSGEDKLVKKALKEGCRAGIYADYSKDVVRPSAQECAQNGRARSTKMRWAVRA